MPLPTESFWGDDHFSLEFSRWPILVRRFQWGRLYRQGRPNETENALIVKGSLRVKRWYDPVADKPELFLEFADLTRLGDRTAIADRVQRFANENGPLRHWDTFATSPMSKIAKEYVGHSWGDWVQESQILRHTVQLWDWTGKSRPDGKADQAALRAAIKWTHERNANSGQDETRVEYCSSRDETFRYVIASSLDPNRRHLLATWKPGERLRPARLWLAHRITQSLARDVSPGFAFLPNPNKPTSAMLPRNLVGALWYQFYRAYLGDLRIARCSAPDCGDWMRFERKSKQMHKDCANRTRVRRFREKRGSQK